MWLRPVDGPHLALLARPHPALAGFDFLHGPAGGNAGVVAVDDQFAGVDLRVFLLDEEPVVALLARPPFHAHKDELTPEALSGEDELEFALCEALVRIADGLPGAAVPQHHRAAAIFALGG